MTLKLGHTSLKQMESAQLSVSKDVNLRYILQKDDKNVNMSGHMFT